VRTSEGYRVLEGVEDLLLILSDTGTMLGLVSGAMEGAARVKLSRADLNRFFVFGGYGSDSDDRVLLTHVAIDKAATLHGHDVTPDRVFVVGDTPLDVEAAHAVGAVSVAVASGRFSVEELRAAGARQVLPSLGAQFPEMSG
jgi:phosphoglycolate phosphatase-like HAD superfamily hydrolase